MSIKNAIQPTEMEPATLGLVAQCLNQSMYSVSIINSALRRIRIVSYLPERNFRVNRGGSVKVCL
jgi:Mn-dependent DtxR family transcriptional regulator